MTTDDHRDSGHLDANPLAALHGDVSSDARMDAGAADRLEAALRVVHAERRHDPAPWWRRSIALAPAAILIVVAITATLVLRTESPSAALVVTDAENVTIVLPGGEVVTDPADGFQLPDGAVIEIGTAGTVSIDDVVIDEPARFSVVDGALVSDVLATTTTPERPDHLDPPSTTAPPVEVTTTTTEPARDTAETTTTAAERPAATTTTEPVRDLGDDRDRDDRDRDDERGGDGDAEPESDEGTEVRIALSVERLDDDGARLTWEVAGALDGWTVSIRRTVGDGEPETVLAGGPLVGELVERFGRDEQGRVRYRLVVLDEGGGVVASAPVRGLRR